MSKSEVVSVHPVDVKVKTTRNFDFKACEALTLAATKRGCESRPSAAKRQVAFSFFAD